MKKTLFLMALICAALNTYAQFEEEYKGAPHWFVGVQGGAATTLNGGEYSWSKLIVPTASAQLGYIINSQFGVRLHANAYDAKIDGAKDGLKDPFKAHYFDGNADLLLNLSTMFGSKDYYPVNVYFVTGVGFCKQMEEVDKYKSLCGRNSANGRLGLGVLGNLSKHWAVNAEIDYNDRVLNHQLTAQIGLSYRFAYGKKPKRLAPNAETGINDYAGNSRTESGNAAPVVADKPNAPKPQPKVEKKAEQPKPVVVEPMKQNIYFCINQTQPGKVNTQKVVDAAQWLKANPEAKCTVTGYADKGTGTAAVNKRMSQRRANNVADKLQALGIDPSRITVEAKGDTVQPFADNNENRVVIIEAK